MTAAEQVASLEDQLEKADMAIDELIAERDEALADAARWKELAETRLARLYEVDPIYQPSAPRDRPRFAGEDPDEYALRGES